VQSVVPAARCGLSSRSLTTIEGLLDGGAPPSHHCLLHRELIVSKLDRLSRSLLDFAGLMTRARDGGWNLVALDLGIDLSTPAGEFMASVMASAAQWERRLIGQRTRDALDRHVAAALRGAQGQAAAPQDRGAVRGPAAVHDLADLRRHAARPSEAQRRRGVGGPARCAWPVAHRIRQAVLLLSSAMEAAVYDDLILRSPCRGLELPELPEPAPRILTPAEVAALRAAIREPYGVVVDVLAYAGLRIGEVLALRRRSVDLLGRRLVVSQSLSEVAGRLTFEAPKSGKARSVALPRFLAEDLTAYLAEHVPADPDALLFTGRTGKAQHYNAWRTWTWDPAAKVAGLSGVTPHALRATCGSWVAEEHGVLEAARRLGHSSASVTTRHYARPLDGGDLAVAEALDGRRTASGPSLRAAASGD